jgi:putative addiction module CopG family antidote
MSEVVPVRLKGKLKEIVDTLVNSGVYGSKSEVIRSGIRRLGEEHGLIATNARYHLRRLQLITKEKDAKEIMDKLDKISD